MNRLRRWAAWPLAVAFALVLAACASVPKPPAQASAELGPWSGRLALQVADKPEASFSAGFELKGNPKEGELSLVSPVGATLGLLQWHPGKAVLRANGKVTEYDSVDALAAQVAGSPIPISALFDWLRGVATPVEGWQSDLSQLANGRIAAHRATPAPAADLRVVLER